MGWSRKCRFEKGRRPRFDAPFQDNFAGLTKSETYKPKVEASKFHVPDTRPKGHMVSAGLSLLHFSSKYINQ